MPKVVCPEIVIDTREQLPYTFPSPCSVQRRVLSTGDYSLCGLEELVFVERKSLDDLAATLGNPQRRKRFYNELARAQAARHKVILVEGSTRDILEHRYTGGINPVSLYTLVLALQIHDPWLSVHFAGDRQQAIAFLYHYFSLIWKDYHASANKARRRSSRNS